jgi:hypothetical protein
MDTAGDRIVDKLFEMNRSTVAVETRIGVGVLKPHKTVVPVVIVGKTKRRPIAVLV